MSRAGSEVDAGARRSPAVPVSHPPASDEDRTQPTPLGWNGRTAARLLAALAAGLLLWLSFPPVDTWWTAPLGVALLILALRRTTWPAALVTAYVAGVALYLPLVSWASEAVGSFPWLVMSLACAGYTAVTGVLVSLTLRLTWWPLAAPAAWIVLEALAGRWPFGGFPWARVAFGQADGPFLGLAALGGSPLVSFAAVLSGTLLAAALVATTTPKRVLAAVTALAVAGLGLLIPTTSAPEGGPVATVAVVQGNVPRLGLDFNEQAYAVLENHVDETLRLADDINAGVVPAPDLVVWPENSVDIDPFTHERSRRLIDEAAAAVGVPIVVGAILDGPGPDARRNASIVWDPQTGPGQMYVKRKPAPFSEYIPLRPLAERLSDKTDLVRRDMVAGDEPGVLQVGPAVLGVTICYELAFDELVRDVVVGGAEVLVLQNNSATFGFTAQSEQQLAQAKLRAVEHDRWALVSTTSGISAVIRPDGTVEQSTEIFTADTLSTEVELRTSDTMATRTGAAAEWFLVVVGVAAVALAIWRTGHNRERRSEGIWSFDHFGGPDV